MINWTLVLMCVLGGVSVAFLIVSFIMASSYRDRSVFWNVFTAASSSGGVATFFWWLCDYIAKEMVSG